MPILDWVSYSNVKNTRELVVCSMTDQITEPIRVMLTPHHYRLRSFSCKSHGVAYVYYLLFKA
jgi:hypothetical protein